MGVIHVADLKFRVIGPPGTYGIFQINDCNIVDTNFTKIDLKSVNGNIYVGPAVVNAGSIEPMMAYYNSLLYIPITI